MSFYRLCNLDAVILRAVAIGLVAHRTLLQQECEEVADRSFVRQHSTEPSTIAPSLKAMPFSQSTTLAYSPKSDNERCYDFIVIGNGTAGSAAVQQLQEDCPSARVALIDPLRAQTAPIGAVDVYPYWASSLDPDKRQVRTMVASGKTQVVVLNYKHGVLLATGARGAPPPHYLMDDTARQQVWELKPTLIRENSLATEQVVQRTLQAAENGERVAILGSGWDALNLAVQTARKSKSGNRPMLIYGSSLPLHHVLPPYLGSMVVKRLQNNRIQVKDRTLIRYISMEEQDAKTLQYMQLYSAKSYDFLDSHMDRVHHIVVAPETSGPRGNATFGTQSRPKHLQSLCKGRSWYHTWSGLDSPIACYNDDGRVAVNAELCCCTGVYAAGSVAKYPNSLSGHATVAGTGWHDGEVAGRVAARNMSRDYLTSFFRKQPRVQTIDSIPIFRTDYIMGPTSALASIGIHALCVGHCDSERFYTHGFWWTHQAAQRRLLQQPGLRRRKSIGERFLQATKPVYGLGVVYYLDRTGRLQGIMMWGLPFTVDGQLNSELVKHMKNLIRSSAFGSLLDAQQQDFYAKLSRRLADESKRLVALSLSSSLDEMRQNLIQDTLPRPLHRLSEIRPPSVRSVRVLKRDGQSHGLLGEDLFSRYKPVLEPRDDDSVAETTALVGSAAADANLKRAQAFKDWHEWEQGEHQWDDNEDLARPPDEDLLWVRKGDEMRSISARDNRLTAYKSAIWKE